MKVKENDEVPEVRSEGEKREEKEENQEIISSRQD